MSDQSQEDLDERNLSLNADHQDNDVGYARFFTEAFLLNRGLFIFQSMIKRSASYALTTAAQLFVFGGLTYACTQVLQLVERFSNA